MLDAEEKLYPAQNAQASMRGSTASLAYVQLYKALGGGWNVPDATAVNRRILCEVANAGCGVVTLSLPGRGRG